MNTVRVKCHYCELEFDRLKEQIVQHKRNNYSHFYCSSKCMAKQKSKDFVDAFKETGLIKCSTCGISKQYSNFNKNKRRSIGYGNQCKNCAKGVNKFRSDAYRLYKNSLKNETIQSNNSGK